MCVIMKLRTANSRKQLLSVARRIVSGEDPHAIADDIGVSYKRVCQIFQVFLYELNKYAMYVKVKKRGYGEYRANSKEWLRRIDDLEKAHELHAESIKNEKEKAKPERKKSGRKAGVPNHDSKKFSLLEYARKNGGTSPVEFLLDIVNENIDKIEGHVITYRDRVDAAKAAAPYCHPKLRSTEIKGEIIPATFIIEDA